MVYGFFNVQVFFFWNNFNIFQDCFGCFKGPKHQLDGLFSQTKPKGAIAANGKTTPVQRKMERRNFCIEILNFSDFQKLPFIIAWMRSIGRWHYGWACNNMVKINMELWVVHVKGFGTSLIDVIRSGPLSKVLDCLLFYLFYIIFILVLSVCIIILNYFWNFQ